MIQEQFLELSKDAEKFNAFREKENWDKLTICLLNDLKLVELNLRNITFKSCDSGTFKSCYYGQTIYSSGKQEKSYFINSWGDFKLENPILTDAEAFARIKKLEIINNSIIIFKSVNPKTNCDFRTGTIKYEGIVECPDYLDKYQECGNGLHLSPTPAEALEYNQGKVLKCKVNLDDISVYPLNLTKVRCRKVEVLND